MKTVPLSQAQDEGSVDKAVPASRRYDRRSQTAEIWRRFRQNKGAMVGLVIVIALALCAIFADVLVDYKKDVVGIHIAQKLIKPCLKHPCGTDDLGRDILSRLLYGTRFSLSIGLVAVLIGMVIGTTLGAIAGYFCGIVEDIIMRLNDILSSVPGILMGIVIVSALGASTFNLMLAIGITSIPQFVRITRAAVLTVRHQDYVESCRATGFSLARIITFHILPNCLSPIIVQMTLRIASAIIAASSLSFLGLGVPPPAPEWGAMLSIGRQYARTYPHLTLFPGLAIMITVLAFNLLGDGLRDSLDPKLRR